MGKIRVYIVHYQASGYIWKYPAIYGKTWIRSSNATIKQRMNTEMKFAWFCERNIPLTRQLVNITTAFMTTQETIAACTLDFLVYCASNIIRLRLLWSATSQLMIKRQNMISKRARLMICFKAFCMAGKHGQHFADSEPSVTNSLLKVKLERPVFIDLLLNISLASSPYSV